jgi:hypothetical protein
LRKEGIRGEMSHQMHVIYYSSVSGSKVVYGGFKSRVTQSRRTYSTYRPMEELFRGDSCTASDLPLPPPLPHDRPCTITISSSLPSARSACRSPRWLGRLSGLWNCTEGEKKIGSVFDEEMGEMIGRFFEGDKKYEEEG